MSASANFAADLLGWHARYGRHDLPWQSDPPDPYRVWLSEVMLQQTQVATVIPYFERFTKKFPTLKALAQASEQEVLALWSGLGYYARARNLLACAREVTRQHGGQFPATSRELARLPGVGPSTAAAIASTVFQERAAILDGNVKRVLARVTCAPQPWSSPALSKALLIEAQNRLPEHAHNMPAYTQAIMDLGATVCRSRNPLCDRCPVSGHCCAFQTETTAQFPVPSAKRKLRTQQIYWCVLTSTSGGVWLEQQPLTGIWGGMWTPWLIEPSRLPSGWASMQAHWSHVIELRHALTHRQLDISVGVFNRARPPRGAPTSLRHFSWTEVFALPLPAPARRVLHTLTTGSSQDRKRP